ncbi:Acetyl-/propionyl-coenzyme A carboxylase alpha chain [Leucobacter sp. BZR 635]|uniref:acetyl/propionyl/methylcrotonyl-CoA carboxylase subunit alpha n=1 Tax=Leucobacter sp. BZR 635 TaxID=3378705 RepID=UPI003A8AFA5D
MAMFSSVLIANRGEIACRIIKTLRELGVRSVAVFSAADADAPHVRLADTAVALDGTEPGSAGGYLSVRQIIAAAQATGAEAIHPGYGFLSEQPALALACAAAGIVFVGPSVEALEVMGDKIRARERVSVRGVPVVPGVSEPGLDNDELVARSARLTFPVLVKPAAGGGGKGMHAVDRAEDLPAALETARREAKASFGDDTLFLERLIARPRHIEVQVVADSHGTVIHLGERECSLQRRHQKVIEEAPAPNLTDELRARLADAAVETARSVDYLGVGTVEFIVSADDPEEFAFMEMNTRLQVEHPVTEEVTGVDLVAAQLRIAAGEPLGLTQDDVQITGHSIEARIYAEDPRAGFLPTGGVLESVSLPSGTGIRVDAALTEGARISSDYDPMLAKVITWASDRAGAIRLLQGALAETVTLGVDTNVEFLRLLLDDPDVRAGLLDTALIERVAGELAFRDADDDAFAAAALVLHAREVAGRAPGAAGLGWRVGEHAAARFRLRVAGAADTTRTVFVAGAPGAARVRIEDGEWRAGSVRLDGARAAGVGSAAAGSGAAGSAAGGPGSAAGTAQVHLDGRSARVHFAFDPRAVSARPGSIDGALRLASDGAAWRFEDVVLERVARSDAAAPELLSPMPGAVVAIHAEDGAIVAAGQPVLSVEAMKMEHVLRAPVDGTLVLRVAAGQQVGANEVLAEVLPVAEAEGGAGASAGANSGAGSEERELQSAETAKEGAGR